MKTIVTEAWIESYDSQTRAGKAMCSLFKESLVIDRTNSQVIKEGRHTPYFGGERSDSKLMPAKNDHLKVVIEVDDEGSPSITSWGLYAVWQVRQRAIDNKPMFRVVCSSRFNGKIQSGLAHKETVFEGDLSAALKFSCRDGLEVSEKDKLAPRYKVGPITAVNKWFKKDVNADGKVDWIKWSDPRPIIRREDSKPVVPATNPDTWKTESEKRHEEAKRLARKEAKRRRHEQQHQRRQKVTADVEVELAESREERLAGLALP